MRNFLEQFAHGNLHAQFLADFADEALFGCFAGLTFAAGKFPKPAQVRAMVALGDKQFAVAEDERGADFDGFTIHDMGFTI